MDVYHHTNLIDTIILTPRNFVRNLPEFELLAPAALSGDIDQAATRAVELHRRGFGQIGKVLSELAYESFRLDRHSDAVSRLDAVFAFENPIDAFEVVSTWSDPGTGDRWVWLCELDETAETSICDVDQFFVGSQPQAESKREWVNHWKMSIERAPAYWEPDSEYATREVLAASELRMIRRIHLRELI